MSWLRIASHHQMSWLRIAFPAYRSRQAMQSRGSIRYIPPELYFESLHLNQGRFHGRNQG